MEHLLRFFSYGRRIRHPFFPDLAAEPAAHARGRAQALAGTFGDLALAAARGAQARRVVYALTSEGEPLSAGERDELWRLFQVPVYALLERGGRVEAWECEAQNGLHVAQSGDGGACACGRPGTVMAQIEISAHARASAHSAGKEPRKHHSLDVAAHYGVSFLSRARQQAVGGNGSSKNG